MEAMYDAVDSALKAAGSTKAPEDYLQFMCLAKRVEGTMEGPNEGGKGKAGIMSHRHRRFMVYVHSKLLIVDDDVALVGAVLHVDHFQSVCLMLLTQLKPANLSRCKQYTHRRQQRLQKDAAMHLWSPGRCLDLPAAWPAEQ